MNRSKVYMLTLGDVKLQRPATKDSHFESNTLSVSFTGSYDLAKEAKAQEM